VNTPAELRCIHHGLRLSTPDARPVETARALVCSEGCRVPVINGIPRFVEQTSYADAFGIQWNAFRKTQLDSHTGTTISRDRLTRCFGGSLRVVEGKSVLEVGCGAGRFTELMLAAGARVFACDLSSAVEANYQNCNRATDYFVCQADVRSLPAARNAFDVVMCLGVIQHTPSPEETMKELASYVRPGGVLVIDHYTANYPQNFLQRNIRKLLIRLPPRVAKSLAVSLARTLLPLHQLTWKNRRGVWRLRGPLLRHSPLIDYRDAYPQLGEERLGEWSILDTNDTLTDYYKHIRTAEEIQAVLHSCGLVELEIACAGNGVEARARMPAAENQNIIRA
jgi:2-polyprenyl-3-methyl-5-hydroxy-6-metoxy-1,4-benzoquinol methylase